MGTGHPAPVDVELCKLKLENEILKKQRYTLRNTRQENSFCQKALKGYDSGMVCRILKVSRIAYYRKAKQYEVKKSEIESAVIHCFQQNKSRYGRLGSARRLKCKALQLENGGLLEF